MTKTIKTLLSLKITYVINGIFYYLKKTPLIKKIVPDFLRDSGGLKTAITIASYILMLVKSVAFKFIYLFFFFMMPISFMPDALSLKSVLHILISTTIIGAGMNSKYFEVNTAKYYGVVLLRMEPRGYYIGEYFYYIFELFVGYIISFGAVAMLLDGVFLPTHEMLVLAVVMPIFTVLIKNIYIAYKLSDFIKTGIFESGNKVTVKSVILLAAILIAGYLPPLLGYSLPLFGFALVALAAVILNIRAIKTIYRFKEYGYLTKQLYFGNLAILTGANTKSLVAESYKKQIDLNTEITSDKTGHAYLNEIFVRRHKKVLTKSANIISIAAAVVLIAAAVFADMSTDFAATVSELILNNMPIMLIFLYYLNRGQGITQSMFINCDNALLSYNFYKTPSAILGVFIERLKSLVLINLLPATVIGVGTSLVLLMSGADIEWYVYSIIILTVMAMSVFFSVHYLVLYYLLQPYSDGLSIKNPIYMVISVVTYLVCWQARELSLRTLDFGVMVIGFTIVYIVVAMILVYKLAPKTFRLK